MRKPVVVRLCNWVGEAVLALPGLLALEAQGHELHLVGKGWARSLFAGHGWTIHVRPAQRGQAIRQLKQLRQTLLQVDSGFDKRANTVLLTNSLSSALEARLAGLKAVGYAWDGRSCLLKQAVPFVPGLRAVDNYWRVFQAFLRRDALLPDALGLVLPDAVRASVREVLLSANVRRPFAVVCPFSGAADTTGKKLWPAFPALVDALADSGVHVLVCPGPGEVLPASPAFARCVSLPGLDLGAYAALLAEADLVVANDTGPGHLAASVGASLVSVFGPGSIPSWSPYGPTVSLAYRGDRWPTLAEVWPLVETKLGHA